MAQSDRRSGNPRRPAQRMGPVPGRMQHGIRPPVIKAPPHIKAGSAEGAGRLAGVLGNAHRLLITTLAMSMETWRQFFIVRINNHQSSLCRSRASVLPRVLHSQRLLALHSSIAQDPPPPIPSVFCSHAVAFDVGSRGKESDSTLSKPSCICYPCVPPRR